MRLPANLAATGKAMLAHHDPGFVRELLGKRPLPRLAAPAQSFAELEKELALTRRRGHSIDDEGVREGVYCIGAPVFDASGRVVAGMGVCLNKGMLNAETREREREVVRGAARVLSQRLGAEVERTQAPAAATSRRAARKVPA
jgi:DNA-binding IclR family transcriptional regulator